MNETPLPSRANDDAKGAPLRTVGVDGDAPRHAPTNAASTDASLVAEAGMPVTLQTADILAVVLAAVVEARRRVAVAVPYPSVLPGQAGTHQVDRGPGASSATTGHPSTVRLVAEAVGAARAIIAEAFPGTDAVELAARPTQADRLHAPPAEPPEDVPLAQRLASAMRAPQLPEESPESALGFPASGKSLDRDRLHQLQVDAVAVAAATMAPFTATAGRSARAGRLSSAPPVGDLALSSRIEPAVTDVARRQPPILPASPVSPLPSVAPQEVQIEALSVSVVPHPAVRQPPKRGVLPPSARRIGTTSAYRLAAQPTAVMPETAVAPLQPPIQHAPPRQHPQPPLRSPTARPPLAEATSVVPERVVPAAPRALPAPATHARGGEPRAWATWLAMAALRLVIVLALAAGSFWTTALIAYRYVDPPASTLMLGQSLLGRPIEQRWVPLERISPHLIRAVIASEDGQFCRHRGVDWSAINEAIGKAAEDGSKLRGASTISMQTVKNLLLWPQAHLLRKMLELPLAYAAERAWGKRRILELYLNIAEWGPSLYGIEAAAQHQFRKSASQLGPREAALLAVSLPNPIERKASRPGPGMSRVARIVETRAARPSLAVGCLGGLGRAVP